MASASQFWDASCERNDTAFARSAWISKPKHTQQTCRQLKHQRNSNESWQARILPSCTERVADATQVMLRPAAEGTGVIAGGAVRVVLELAGVKNAFGKQLGSDSPLNNARATLTAISGMRTFKEVSSDRGISVQELMGLQKEKKGALQTLASGLQCKPCVVIVRALCSTGAVPAEDCAIAGCRVS